MDHIGQDEVVWIAFIWLEVWASGDFVNTALNIRVS
jgi:hypothetical protein